MSRDSPQDMPPDLRTALDTDERTDGRPPDEPAYDDLWRLLGSARPPDSALPDAADTWEGVQAHLDADDERSAAETARRARSRGPATRSAHRSAWTWSAVTAVLLVAAVGAWLWFQPVTVTTPPGTAQTQTLPDGSVVELNGGTRLTYARSYSTLGLLQDSRRTVALDGEAYFEVRSGARPFIVETQTAQVEVMGTSFSVRTDGATQTHVALAEGRVRVQSQSGSDDGTTLSPGQAVHVSASGAVSAPVDTSLERVTAWRTGGFAVTAQPLPAIADALEQRFGAPIQLSASIPQDVTSDPLTLYYSSEVDVETVLHDISLARGLSYRPTAEGGYVVSARQSTK